MKPFILAFFFTLVASTRAQSCYFTDGSLSPSDLPCTSVSSGNASMCCAANEYCFSNGLCISPSTNTFNRGSCTDQSWKSSNCAHYCTNELFAGVYPCGGNNMSCTPGDCSNVFAIPSGEAIWNNQLRIDLGVASSVAASASSVQATAAPTVTATITAKASCTSTASAALSPTNNGVSSGVAAAIGVGVGIPLLIALAAALFMLRREKRKNKDISSRPAGLEEVNNLHPSSYQSQSSGYNYQNPPPAFGSHNSYNNHIANKQKPAEMGQTTEVSANELSGTPAW